MPDTFDTPRVSLPPITAALRACWDQPAGFGAPIDAVAAPFSMRAVLDAVHALESRLISLDG
jgi:hypothetical protein